jgi:hypothetical protein
VKIIGRLIWGAAEAHGIDLGRWAPIVFGWMIGRKGRRVKK